ncbi:MAG TPA: cytochrome c peroxidase [Bacteroidia bacterium]|nr:cytochrome c peroxidase [Bacteroidia bacterium]HQF27628.1 cytochrome c peroxidase [Bacteroidia bacterium]
MKAKVLLLIVFSIFIVAFRSGNDNLFVVPAYFPKPVYNFEKNPLSEQKVLLGRLLFYDPQLSRNNMISCASCHSQFSAFTHIDHALSHGIEDKIGFRNSPALMNLAWQKSFMRDGAVNHLDVQALAPLSNPVEMDESLVHVVSKLQQSKIYPQLFYNAFGDSIITGEHTLKAISQFMLTLISANSKYDSVMRNESVFTAQEYNGYQLFKKNCASCHKEPLFTNDEFMNNGLALDSSLNDFGRYRVTKNTEDSLKFKVPTLRNIEFSYPYMHDGRMKRISEVLDHYSFGIQKSKTLATELKQPIVLSPTEKIDLTAFLLTLTDKSFLFNPKFFYPKEIFQSTAKD